MKFKLKSGLAVAALAVFVGSASAADLAAIEETTWTGAYVGLHGGYANLGFDNGWCADTTQDSSVNGVEACVAEVVELGGDGWLWGGQIGYNHQLNDFVLGIEADVSQVFSSSATGYIESDGTDVDSSEKADLDVNALASVRARLGFAFDDIMIYATGGMAYLDATFGAETNDSDPMQKISVDSWLPVAGAGVEWMVHEKASIKLEGLYYFQSDYVDVRGLGNGETGNVNLSNEVGFDNIMTVRVGLNYHF